MCVLCYRLFEPDPAAFGSASEIDGCEKFLMDMLTRVVERKNYLLSNHMAPFDPTAPGMQGGNGPQMYVHHHHHPAPQQAAGEGSGLVGAFAADAAALWASDPSGGPSNPAHHNLFAASDPMIYLRDQDVYEASSSQAAAEAAADHHQQQQAEAWRQAYTCTELLSTLIPATPFPLMQHCLGPDDGGPYGNGGLPAMATTMQQQQEVEASASCSYTMPTSDETAGTPPVLQPAAYDSAAMPPGIP